LGWPLVASLVGLPITVAAVPAQTLAQQTSDFTRGLVAPRADSAGATLLRPFGRLVGTWDLDVTYYPEAGEPETLPGEWHFAWVLEGRAVQDVWRVWTPAGDARGPWLGLGTTVRVFDADLGAWRSTWISALTSSVTPFIGREVDGELRLEPEVVGGPERYRWVFFEVRDDTFRWRAESSTDGGVTWRIEQAMWATRRPRG
jgi:hypothetical protein